MPPTVSTRSENIRAQSVRALNKLLAAVNDLHVQVKQAQWNLRRLWFGAKGGPDDNVSAVAGIHRDAVPARADAAHDSNQVAAQQRGSPGRDKLRRERPEPPLWLVPAALCLLAGAALVRAGDAGPAIPLFLAAVYLAGLSMLPLFRASRRPTGGQAD